LHVASYFDDKVFDRIFMLLESYMDSANRVNSMQLYETQTL